MARQAIEDTERLRVIYAIFDELPHEPNTGCKIWERKSEVEGYPTIWHAGKNKRCNRLVLERKLGRKLLPKLQACHTCDTRVCVAEDHLYEGTSAQNALDSAIRLRRRMGERNHKSKLTTAQVLEIRRLAALKELTHEQIGAKFGM